MHKVWMRPAAENLLTFINVKEIAMTMIPGITIQKNAEGRITHVTIDVEKQKELAQPVLEKLGDEKSDFRQRFEKGLTIEEARQDMIKHIKKLYAGNR